MIKKLKQLYHIYIAVREFDNTLMYELIKKINNLEERVRELETKPYKALQSH